MQLKLRYVEVPGKKIGDNDDLDYDNCDLDELNSYDGFAGVTEINSVSNENTANDAEILGSTNGTPV